MCMCVSRGVPQAWTRTASCLFVFNVHTGKACQQILLRQERAAQMSPSPSSSDSIFTIAPAPAASALCVDPPTGTECTHQRMGESA